MVHVFNKPVEVPVDVVTPAKSDKRYAVKRVITYKSGIIQTTYHSENKTLDSCAASLNCFTSSQDIETESLSIVEWKESTQ